MPPRFVPLLVCASVLALLSACTLGPDYVKPPIKLPEQFKAAQGWKTAQPKDDLLPGNWWQIFGDPQLDKLEQQVAGHNLSLAAAEAQYRQAQYLAQSASAAYLPTLGSTATVNRFKAASGQSVAVSGIRNLFGTALNIAWEPDLWGKVRRQVEADTSSAQASAASLQALRLSLQATLAQDYFQLRALDAQQAVQEKTVLAYQKTLQIIRNRYAVGVAARSDILQAEAQLAAAQAQATDVGVARAQMEHAVAVLVGKTPAELNIARAGLDGKLPDIPPAVPSALLERRPDIANAERLVAAANAQIGVAKAAYYPSFSLSASNGYQTVNFSKLFSTASRYWALGPAAAAWTVFDGGLRSGQVKQAVANFDASVAQYRQSVLTAFQEVEDNLSALQTLAKEAEELDNAVQAAQAMQAITQNQFQAGTVGTFEMLNAEANALNQQKAAVAVLGQRFNHAVLLVKALGGGWTSQALPDKKAASGSGENLFERW